MQIKTRTIATRSAGQHVGEMALIDPLCASRSATFIANQETIIATVSATDFAATAEAFPSLWRRLAIELGTRLRERSQFIHAPNETPIIFIGSSKEAFSIAQSLEAGLKNVGTAVRLWSEGVFRASLTTIEDLELQAQGADFAVLVASPDDAVSSRGNDRPAPRDNAVLELGSSWAPSPERALS